MNDFLEHRKKRLEEFKKNVRKKQITYKPLDIPEGLFIKCDQCGAAIYEKTLQVDHYVCPFCAHKGEATTQYKRKTYQGIPSYLFDCGGCQKKIAITKKLKDSKK